MMKDSSIKLMVMIARKIILQKRMVKYQAVIEDINEYLEDHLKSTKQLKDFEQIFNKLKTEYKHKLIDTDDEDDDENLTNNDKMEIVNNNNNKQ